jgi:hypothetical protein
LILDYHGAPPRYHSLGTLQDTDHASVSARVESALREGSKKRDELMESLNIGWTRLKRVLNRMVVEKRIERHGKGVKTNPHAWTLITASGGSRNGEA